LTFNFLAHQKPWQTELAVTAKRKSTFLKWNRTAKTEVNQKAKHHVNSGEMRQNKKRLKADFYFFFLDFFLELFFLLFETAFIYPMQRFMALLLLGAIAF